MLTSSFLLTLSSTLFAQNVIPQNGQNCFVMFNGSTFDVCDLQTLANQNTPYYTIQDMKNSQDGNDKYKYLFNIGGALPEDPPLICSNSAKNHSYHNGSDIIAITDIVWAYQIKFSGNQTHETDIDCFYLSNEIGGPLKWSLINDLNPVEGVTLTYLNGDYDSNCGKNREFSIKFQCENTGAGFNPFTQSNINEYSLCSYTWTVESLYGCPTQCPWDHHRPLCSDHGLCSYDHTNHKSRCYCYGKYQSTDCSVLNNASSIDEQDTTKPKPPPSQFVHTFHYNSAVNITYDLSAWNLTHNSLYYQILDKFNTINTINTTNRSVYIYYIGIMQEIETPKECNPQSVSVSAAYAFQMDNETKECYVLGTTAQWNYFDEIDDPARGVTITYSNGDAADACGEDVNREFSVSLVCPNEAKEFDRHVETTITTFVQESQVCKYNIEISSAFACPYQCLTSVEQNINGKFSVCSNHGMCVADPFAGYVRCLCDDTWSGSLCNKAPTQSPTVNPTQSPTNNPSVAPTKSPTQRPTQQPTQKPTQKPTQRPTYHPSKSPIIPPVITQTVHDDHTAFTISILALCVVIIIAICVGRYCYKRIKNTHEEFKEYTQFRDNTNKKKLAGSVGFAMRNATKVSNVGDAFDEENEDQLL